jgi:UDP-glucose 4-epimerase
MSILVTGGAGYIGSHAVLRLLRDGQSVVVIDDLSRGNARAIESLKRAVPGAKLAFHHLSIGDTPAVEKVLREHGCKQALHFAAFTYVGESVNEPLKYYENNFGSTARVLTACHNAGVERLVFSSTAATYGEPAPDRVPIREDLAPNPINPYGMSKLMVERMLWDYTHACAAAGRPFACAALRYFNVAGCDPSGLIGEVHDPETHLIPVILHCLLGKRPAQQNTLTVFGTDYPTPDGTCVRDYVHVEDLVDAHIKVLGAMKPGDKRVYNLGLGKGISVKEIIESVQRVTGKQVNVKYGPRRAGDPAVLFADPAKIRHELGWSAKWTDLDKIVASAWNWFSKN